MKKCMTIMLCILLCLSFTGCIPAPETEPSSASLVKPTVPVDPTDPTEPLVQVSYQKTFYIIDSIKEEILGSTQVVIEGWLDADGHLDGYMNVEAYPISREYMDGTVSKLETKNMDIYSCQQNDYFYPDVEGYYIISIAKEDSSLALATIVYGEEIYSAISAESEEEVWDNYRAYFEIFGDDETLESE